MYSTVAVRIGISWCVQYCVSKDRDLQFYCFYCSPTVSDAFLLCLMFLLYCFSIQKLARGVAPQSLSQVHASFRRYMYDHQVGEAECPL